jgi:hypothetical protein
MMERRRECPGDLAHFTPGAAFVEWAHGNGLDSVLSALGAGNAWLAPPQSFPNGTSLVGCRSLVGAVSPPAGIPTSAPPGQNKPKSKENKVRVKCINETTKQEEMEGMNNKTRNRVKEA